MAKKHQKVLKFNKITLSTLSDPPCRLGKKELNELRGVKLFFPPNL